MFVSTLHSYDELQGHCTDTGVQNSKEVRQIEKERETEGQSRGQRSELNGPWLCLTRWEGP